jgi:hydroxyethylthiazole kinase-like uncharacterized protein yjeF
MHAIKTPIYQTQQIREFEQLVEERFGITSQVLMQRAGKAAFDYLMRRWPQAQKLDVFCGGGNNGGDGYVLAHIAAERGLKVSIWQVGSQENTQVAAQEALEQCRKANLPINPFNSKIDLQHTDVIIDAICGIGLHKNLRSDVISAIEKMQQADVPIFALDIPSGVDADTGQVMGGAVHASATMTFVGLKIGLMTGSGAAYTGELVSNDLQLPAELFTYVEPVAKKVHLSTYSHFLKARLRDWHKGLAGHVLVVGGELGFSGAPMMAAQAALRAGAGLVSVATHVEHIQMNAHCPEVMCHGVTSAEQLNPLIERADVVVIGPGLGQTDWSKALWQHISNADKPLLVDGDGLNLLAAESKLNDNWVLTPHPGEAARLLQTTTQAIQKNRLDAIKAIQKKFGGVCVLKGVGSLILAPNALPALCDKGNPGMATAGMGDILSGVIGALMAQGIPPGDAAKLGVCVHAIAGDQAAKDGERGMMATDLLMYIRRLVNLS